MDFRIIANIIFIHPSKEYFVKNIMLVQVNNENPTLDKKYKIIAAFQMRKFLIFNKKLFAFYKAVTLHSIKL